MRVRRATQEDVASLLSIKHSLTVPATGGDLSQGGFLLGSTADQYQFFIEHANVLVLCEGARGVGFSITLPDPVLRRSELWSRRERVCWEGLDLDGVEQGRIGYIEQLALLPGERYRRYAPAFALATLLDLSQSGHQHLFTTVLRRPVANQAPLPLLGIIGARRVGHIEEHYQDIGQVVSDIYYLNSEEWNYNIADGHPLFPLRQRIRRMLDGLSRSGEG